MNSNSTPAAAAIAAPGAIRRGTLGTFAGVFTPSILTILGIVLFLRLGYVVGGAGLGRALLVIVAANAISLVTALSLAAVATNLRVKAGGDYYLISRTLGPGFGGAIGLVLFFAQAVSIGFYCIGFAEAVVPILPPAGTSLAWLGAGHPLALHAVALAAVGVLGLLAWIGADLATRFQYAVMVLLALGIASFASGAVAGWDGSTLARNWSAPADGLPFWVAFAIFFPAVTGFTQGVSMSGDLARPSVSIPRGVLMAVGLSVVIYLGAALLFAAALPNAALRADTGVMKQLAWQGPLVDLGVMAATLSSALASFLGAPRILQSLAADGVFPWLGVFAHGSGPTHNPRRAVLPTLVVAVAVVMLGELDLIAAVVSMFFLVSYGLLNYATWYEARSGSPSFRPTFRWYDHRIALAGAAACLAAMLAIDPLAGLFATAVVYAIYRWLERSDAPVRWTDGRRAFHLQRARDHLLAADAEPQHARAWRPQLLVFSDAPASRERLLRFAHWVEGRAGLTTVARLVVTDPAQALERRRAETEALEAELKAAGSRAFPLVVVGDDANEMLSVLVQAAGVGPLRVNTAVANWPRGDAGFYAPLGLSGFGRSVAAAFRLGTNLLLLDADAKEWETLQSVPSDRRVIDVWWRDTPTGELMLLLAFLMMRSDDWGRASIRLLAAPDEGQTEEACRAAVVERLERIRIPATAVVVADHDEATVIESSRAGSIVFMPFRIHGGRFYSPFGWEIREALPRLPITVLALAAEDVDLEADPDDAQPAEGPKRMPKRQRIPKPTTAAPRPTTLPCRRRPRADAQAPPRIGEARYFGLRCMLSSSSCIGSGSPCLRLPMSRISCSIVEASTFALALPRPPSTSAGKAMMRPITSTCASTKGSEPR